MFIVATCTGIEELRHSYLLSWPLEGRISSILRYRHFKVQTNVFAQRENPQERERISFQFRYCNVLGFIF